MLLTVKLNHFIFKLLLIVKEKLDLFFFLFRLKLLFPDEIYEYCQKKAVELYEFFFVVFLNNKKKLIQLFKVFILKRVFNI